MSIHYVADKLNEAADSIAQAMTESDFVGSALYLNLRDNVVHQLDKVRAAIHLEIIDEARRGVR